MGKEVGEAGKGKDEKCKDFILRDLLSPREEKAREEDTGGGEGGVNVWR